MKKIPDTFSLGKLRWLYDIPFDEIPQLAIELKAKYNCSLLPTYQGRVFSNESFNQILDELHERGKQFCVARGISRSDATMLNYDKAWGWAVFSSEADILLRNGYNESFGKEYDCYPMLIKFTDELRQQKKGFYSRSCKAAFTIYMAILDMATVETEKAIIHLHKKGFDRPSVQYLLSRNDITITHAYIDAIITDYERKKKSPHELWEKKRKHLTKPNEKRSTMIAILLLKNKLQTEIYDIVFKDREKKRVQAGKPASSPEEKRKEVSRHKQYIIRIATADPKNLLPLPESLK